MYPQNADVIVFPKIRVIYVKNNSGFRVLDWCLVLCESFNFGKCMYPQKGLLFDFSTFHVMLQTVQTSD